MAAAARLPPFWGIPGYGGAGAGLQLARTAATSRPQAVCRWELALQQQRPLLSQERVRVCSEGTWFTAAAVAAVTVPRWVPGLLRLEDLLYRSGPEGGAVALSKIGLVGSKDLLEGSDGHSCHFATPGSICSEKTGSTVRSCHAAACSGVEAPSAAGNLLSGWGRGGGLRPCF